MPLPEFTNSNGGHTVLLFVTSFNIQLPVRSDDPIFPARDQVISNPTGDPDIDNMNSYWTNNEKHGAVLGCVEYIELCKTASNDSCFDPWEISQLPAVVDEETYATALALFQSGFWPTIKTRPKQSVVELADFLRQRIRQPPGNAARTNRTSPAARC